MTAPPYMTAPPVPSRRHRPGPGTPKPYPPFILAWRQGTLE